MKPLKPLLIGISGLKNSGKDTLGNFLKKYLTDFKVEIKKFDDMIKKVTAVALDCTVEDLENRDFKENFIHPVWKCTPRKFMQIFGTEFGREIIRESIWIDMFKHQNKDCEADVVLITGVRFDNEIKFIKKEGGINIFIQRGDLFSTQKDTHESEARLEEISKSPDLMEKYFEIVVRNSGTIKSFETTGKTLANIIKQRINFKGK